MSGGGSSAPAQPSTTTTVQDIPAWEQGYVTNLLGQAQTEAAQPYQQFTGPQVAGFTPDQTQAFSNIENASGTNAANQTAATNQVNQGVNSANSIYSAGAGDINAATAYNPLAAVAPYLGAASTYNSATAAQPYLNQSQGYNAAAAGVATPQGIQSYLSPYTSNVVQGIQNEANENWNQNIMPGVNNEFIGSGQFGSGRDAQVLGQAAGNFQTGLSANVANALQSGYTTAGQQAATEAGILGNSANTAISGGNAASAAQGAQVSNLLNQANAAGSSTQQQASNLLGQGTALGNLANTQTGAQLSAGETLGNLGAQQAATNLTQNQALQATGQEQQQLNQTNLNTAMQNFENQVQYPEQQTQFLNQIVRGLPAPTASTSAGQTTPAYSVSPLSAVGGAGTTALALTGSGGNALGTATAVNKKGGLIKGYAAGGTVTTGDDDDTPTDPLSQMAMYNAATSSDPSGEMANAIGYKDTLSPLDLAMPDDREDDVAPSMPQQQSAPQVSRPVINPLNIPDVPQTQGFTPQQMQQNQLLALARGLLTPSISGSTAAAVGQGLGNLEDVTMKQQQMMQAQRQQNYENQMKQVAVGQEQEKIDQGKYTPIKDFYGNVTGVMETKTGKVTPTSSSQQNPNMVGVSPDEPPSSDPQKAAAQILAEQGSVPTQVGNKFDIAGRNKQTDAYNNAALAAKSTMQQLNALDAQTGKYTPGKVMGTVYGGESAVDMGGQGATARAEADKASKALANSFMQANAGARGSGIKMVQFDVGAVPNADMTDDARTDLINKNKAIANSQIQRGVISNMYPRMQMSNVNAIMDNYETKNPPVLATGSANPNWMSYADWLKAGRPDTTALTGGGTKAAPSSGASSSSGKVASQSDLAAVAQKYGKTIDQVRQDAIAKGYKIQ